MNQKNIFTGISFFLLIWALLFYFMGDKLVGDTFPGLGEEGTFASIIHVELASAFILIVALMVWATRNVPQVLGYFTIGTTILFMVTLKHIFADDIAVPTAAPIFQGIVVLLSGYLWYKNKNANSDTAA